MGLLISNDRVPVKFGMTQGDPKEVNTVWVKSKLGSADRIFIQRALFRVPMQTGGDGMQEVEFAYSPDEAREVNLIAAVVDWEGPIFEGQEYEAKIWPFIDLDNNGWWLDLVNEKIDELTKPQTEPPAPANGAKGKGPKSPN